MVQTRLLVVAVVVLWGAAGVRPAWAEAERTFCTPTEAVVFSCAIGPKRLSLCLAGERRLLYRFGKPAKLELVYPANGAEGRFSATSLPTVGGGETDLRFQRGAYVYRVYSRVSRSEPDASGARVPEFTDGLQVLKGGREVSNKTCDDGGAGFRIDLQTLLGTMDK